MPWRRIRSQAQLTEMYPSNTQEKRFEAFNLFELRFIESKWFAMVLLVMSMLWFPVTANAAEGMWTLDNLPHDQLRSQYQFQATDAWLDKVMHSSLRLLPGCSASFVSSTGLVLTNHHCVRRCIEELSSKNRNLMTNGYLARKQDAELKCPDAELDQLQSVTDITAAINAATKDKSGTAFAGAFTAAATAQVNECMSGSSEEGQRCDVIEMYHGGKYFLYRYRCYQDVRVVWAPEFSVAFFGGDPDNFNFPRFNLDAVVLRVYEGDKPVQNRDYFSIKRSGAEQNELLFSVGNPGRTQRELTVAQLMTLRNIRLPRQLVLSAEYRGLLEQYQKNSSEAARIATAELYATENRFKSARGQLEALNDERVFEQKRVGEDVLRKYVSTHPEIAPAINAWKDIEKAEAAYRALSNEYYFLESGRGFLSKYCSFARTLVRHAIERTRPDADHSVEYIDTNQTAVEQSLFSDAPIYPAFEKVKLSWSLTKMREWLGPDHPVVRKILGNESPDVLASRWIASTQVGKVSNRRLLWSKPELVLKSNDPFIKLALLIDEATRPIRRRYADEVEGVEQHAGELIAAARFAMTGTNNYPDATFSLRLSYGEVKGWLEDGRAIDPVTSIGGIFQRDTGAFPFALPKSWLDAKSILNQSIPFDFVTTHDIAGGSSGSAVINRDAELVGLAFDGNIHSLGGAFGYDESLNRTIALHPAALVHALRNIYHADELLKELDAK